MASSGKYVKVLRTMRAVLVREMPDVSVLLSTAELGPHFTSYEKNEATSPQRASERAEKLLQIMTYKSYEVYQKFVCVVRQFRPELAVKLEGAERQTSMSSTASSPESNGSPPVCESSAFCVLHMILNYCYISIIIMIYPLCTSYVIVNSNTNILPPSPSQFQVVVMS